MINKFRDKYEFLSNFYRVNVYFEGLMYSSSEAAYQASKTLDKDKRLELAHSSPSVARRMGRFVELRPDWEEIKLDVMYRVCKAKFDQNPFLQDRLLETGDEYIEEGNNWGDRFWGTVNGVGENNLGKVLMRIREEYNDKR